ncbi:CQI_4a_G0009120.mRNA.1.CDS.1 [Saccharomyces cerevisiae]|nr:CQI_4a_G0009120.mRNA.1.CDS.1 [Saccharomyces cerevisiae]CAI7196450.1 CQI_4a_G0009120.mRNA.1.CDS.1 [Saccharomyces cerevisiae]
MSLYQSIVFIARNVVNSITRILHDHPTNSSLITQTYFITPNHSGKNISFHLFHDFKYCSADTRHYSQLIIFPVKENSRPTQCFCLSLRGPKIRTVSLAWTGWAFLLLGRLPQLCTFSKMIGL